MEPIGKSYRPIRHRIRTRRKKKTVRIAMFRCLIFAILPTGAASAAAHYGGTDLSLPITESLVRMMGGEVKVGADGIGAHVEHAICQGHVVDGPGPEAATVFVHRVDQFSTEAGRMTPFS